MHLHSEVPILPFLCSEHFKIVLLVSVFRRTRRSNKRTVYNRTFAEEKTSVGKLSREQIKDLFV